MKFKKCVMVGMIFACMLSIVGCSGNSTKSVGSTENQSKSTTTTSQENVATKDDEKVSLADFPMNKVIQTKYPASVITFQEISYNSVNKGLYLKFNFKNLGTEPIEGRNLINNTVFQNGIEIPSNDGVSSVGDDPIKDNSEKYESCNKNAATKVQQGYEMKDCEVKFTLEPVDTSQIEVDFSSVPYKVLMNLQ